MTRFCIVAVAVIMTTFATGLGENRRPYPTNLELIHQASDLASQKIVIILDTMPKRFIFLANESPRNQDWHAESSLVTALTQNGFKVYNVLLEGDSVSTLRFRVFESSITYRKRPTGVERTAKTILYYTITLGVSGKVLSSNMVQGTVQDIIPPDHLSEVENKEISPILISTDERLSSRIFEPALISIIAGGLIYLFYSSRAPK